MVTRLITWLKITPWYPLLLAWYPVLFLYQTNIRLVVPKDLWVPLSASTAAVCLSLLLLHWRLRNWYGAALVVAIAELIFFSHGHLRDVMGAQIGWENYKIATDWILLSAWVCLLAGVGWALHRGSRGRRMVGLANGGAGLLLLMAIVQIGWYYVTVEQKAPRSQASVESVTTAPLVQSATVDKPDVYYFIFDKHAAASTYQNDYGYNEEPFLNQLRQLGFYVAEDSHTNYPKTSFSIASSLNMNYLSNLLGSVPATALESSTVDKLYGQNQVGQYLQQRGYTYYNLGSWFEDTQDIAEANVNVSPQSGDFLQYDSFSTKLLDTTLYPVLLHLIDPSAPSLDWIDQHRQWATYQYDKMPSLINQPGPKFVFAHILQPHNPFVFDQHCQPISVDISNQAAIPYYVNQTICTDQHMVSIMKQVLATAATPPVIVLQADEGPEAMAYPLPNAYTFKDASLTSIAERTSILNAYYFPDQDYSQLSQTITPVNSFRIIFNQYFGGNFPLLENRTFVFADNHHLFDLTDVTEQLSK